MEWKTADKSTTKEREKGRNKRKEFVQRKKKEPWIIRVIKKMGD